MTIFTDGLREGPPVRYIEDAPARLADTIGDTASSAFMGTSRSIAGSSEMAAAQGIAPSTGDFEGAGPYQPPGYRELFENQPDMPIDQARAQVKAAGLEKTATLPDQPTIKAPAVDLMIKRGQETRESQTTQARGPGGITQFATNAVTSLAVGAIDPVNAAAAFMPVVPEAIGAKLLASAGESVIGRAAARAAVGATQGAVGTAALLPLEAFAKTQEGQDYTLNEALNSILFGAGVGGLLHAGPGAIADLVRGTDVMSRLSRGEQVSPEDLARLGQETKPASAVAGEAPRVGAEEEIPPHPAEILSDLPPEVQRDVLQASIADLTNGTPVRAAEILADAAKEDPRIAESVKGTDMEPRATDEAPSLPPTPADRDATYQRLSQRPDNDPELTQASKDAEHTPEPPSTDPVKTVSAAEKAAADAEEQWKGMQEYLTDEERQKFNDALQELDREGKERQDMISAGAACLSMAIA